MDAQHFSCQFRWVFLIDFPTARGNQPLAIADIERLETICSSAQHKHRPFRVRTTVSNSSILVQAFVTPFGVTKRA